MRSKAGEVIQCERCGVYNDPIDMNMFQGEVSECADRKNCATRQRLHSKAIINNASRRKMSQEAPVEYPDPDQYTKKAKALVCEAFNQNYGLREGVKRGTPEDFYVVWFSKVLGNWKAMVSTDLVPSIYYEATYDGNKKQTYVDFYVKAENICFTDMDHHRLVTPMEERNYEFRTVPGVGNDVTVSRDGDVKVGGRDYFNVTKDGGIRKTNGEQISIQMAVHLAFPDIPMRHIPTS